MKNKFYLLKYAMNYLSKFNSSKKNLERILKSKVQRTTKDKKERFELYSSIDYVFNELEKNNLVNDNNYTQSKIYLLVTRGKSKQFIQNYLMQKGIKKSIIIEEINIFEKNNYEWEEKSAYTFAKKNKLLDKDTKIEKKLSKMARAGFTYELSKKIIKQ